MGRSDLSKPIARWTATQHFGGSHVSPRDQVGSRSGIRGGGDRIRHCLAHAHLCSMACHALAPCRCSRTSQPYPEGRQ
ncbi:hypothetical protein GW17_00056001, partial [Ensete ventricosum]